MPATLDPLTIADRALLSAIRAWGAEPESRFWDRFRPRWSETLRSGWEQAREETPEAAKEQLRLEHCAEIRADLSRIHPSWWIRALKDETPAVRRAVVANAPSAIREALRTGLELTEEDLETGRAPVPEVLQCALALWTERLVGDVSDRDDDPPVIVALTRFDRLDVARLVLVAGLAKWAIARQEPPGLRERDRERYDQFRDLFGDPSPRLKQLAKHDVARHGTVAKLEGSRLGLVTIARLLDVAEPYRVRWALQHLPYSIAKFLRTLMNPRPARDSSLAYWETKVLKAAWDRLHAEGRFPYDFGGIA